MLVYRSRLFLMAAFALAAFVLVPSAARADAGNAQVVQAEALIRAAKYADAKALLQAYLATASGDTDALLLLAVADEYLDDSAGAVAAFDIVGTIPERFRLVALKAYADAAVDRMKAKDNARAIALATKSIALQRNVNNLFIRGTAYANAQKYPEAIADLERAKAMAVAGKADSATLEAIDASLVTSYLFGGFSAKGLALARDLKKHSPSSTRVDDSLAAYYNQLALTALKAGKKDQAVADLEKAAVMVPSRAVVLYVQAANVLSAGTPINWKRVKAEADKALAIDPKDPRANYVAGISVANAGDRANALPYLQRAKMNAGSDAALNADIDAAIARLTR